jgi:response regulator NasT
MTNLDDKCSLNPKTILLVDDDRLIISTLSTGLRNCGYQVNTAVSVDKAICWLDGNERPSLVIIDVNMPERNGFELAKHLSELDNIPFILLTAYSDQDIISRANEAGAMGYLVKPVHINQLIPAIETAISRANYQKDLFEKKDQLQTALDSDRTLSVAIGIMMVQFQVGRETAIKLLRKHSRIKNIKLHELASVVIKARETLNFEIEP